MRIAFFTENYFPMVSGVSTSIKLFKEELEAGGHEVLVFAPSYGKSSDFKDEAGVIRLPALPIRIHQTPIVFPGSSWKQFMVPHLKLDIIHVHHPFFLGRTALFWARLLKIPIVYTFHTLYEAYVHYTPFKRDIAVAFIKRYVRKFANQVDLVISPSFSIKGYLERRGIKSPIAVIPTGIKWEEFQRKPSPSDRKEKILMFVGRLGEEKNVPFLLNILFKIRNKDWKAIFVGDGPDREKFVRMVKDANMGNRILFLGMLTPRKLRELYARAYLFLFSSFTETQGLVILEAMASGVPVLAMKAPGVSDFVHSGYTGFLANSEKDFYEKLVLLLENEDLHAEMSFTARKWAKLWDISLMASKLLYTYEKLREAFSPPSRLKALSTFVFL